MTLRSGDVLADRYEVISMIAAGGMGEVWKARDRVIGRLVAVKVLKPEYSTDPTFLARFRNEARHAGSLAHPHIAYVHDYGETRHNGSPLAFLVMELVDGSPLSASLTGGALRVDRVVATMVQAADALTAAHDAGLVHRDIKPGNLLLRSDGQVKLTDFGIAWARDATALTVAGSVIGTPQYISPEQAQGLRATPASDVYSLGVVAYECLAGRRPFDGPQVVRAHVQEPPPPLPSAIPADVRAVVARSLAKDPAKRYPNGAALAAAWRAVAVPEQRQPSSSSHGPMSSPRSTPAPPSPPRKPTAVLPPKTPVARSTGGAGHGVTPRRPGPARSRSTAGTSASARPRPPTSRSMGEALGALLTRLLLLALALLYAAGPWLTMYLFVFQGGSSVSSSEMSGGQALLSVLCFFWLLTTPVALYYGVKGSVD